MRKNLSLILFGLLIFTPLVISTGCSNDLSRSKAADLISKNANFPAIQHVAFIEGDSVKKSIFSQLPQTVSLYRAMESLGLIDSDSKLTEKGKTTLMLDTSAPKEFSMPVYSVPLGKGEIIEVTGISEGNATKGNAFKEAIFTWHWKSVNDIGKAMNVEKETYTGSATFKKFDDAWRVENIELGNYFPPGR